MSHHGSVSVTLWRTHGFYTCTVNMSKSDLFKLLNVKDTNCSASHFLSERLGNCKPERTTINQDCNSSTIFHCLTSGQVAIKWYFVEHHMGTLQDPTALTTDPTWVWMKSKNVQIKEPLMYFCGFCLNVFSHFPEQLAFHFQKQTLSDLIILKRLDCTSQKELMSYRDLIVG